MCFLTCLFFAFFSLPLFLSFSKATIEKTRRRPSLTNYTQALRSSGRKFFFQERTGLSDDELSTDDDDDNTNSLDSDDVDDEQQKQQKLIKELREENEKLKTRLSYVQEDKKKLKRRLSSVNDQVNNASKTMLSTSLHMANARYSTLEVELREAQEHVADLTEEIQQLKIENTKLQSQSRLQRHSATNIETMVQLKQLKEKIQILEDTNKDLMLENMRKDLLTGTRTTNSTLDFISEEGDMNGQNYINNNNNNTIQQQLQGGGGRGGQVAFSATTATSSSLTPQEFRTLRSTDLIGLSKACLFFSSVLLTFGSPQLACIVSASSIILFLIQKKPTLTLLKDMKKWIMAISVSFLASAGSWFLLVSAFKGTRHSYPMLLLGKVVHVLSGVGIGFFLKQNHEAEPDNINTFLQGSIQFMDVHIRILEGRNLVAKDKNIFGKHTTSDPYIKIYHANNYVGETAIVWKTLNPVWKDEKFKLPVIPKALKTFDNVEFNIYDRDRLSSDDSMGTVNVPIPLRLNKKVTGWYPVMNGKGTDFCKNATGELRVEIELRPLLSKSFKQDLHLTSMRMSSRKLVVD